MKYLKKMFSVMLALAMMFALAVTASATGENATLTVKGAIKDKQYDLYKVFDDDGSGNYTANSDFADFFTAKGAAWANPAKKIAELQNNSTELSNLAAELLAYATENDISPAKTTDAASADGDIEVTGMDYGYYLMSPLGGTKAKNPYATMFSLNTLSGDKTEISVKAEYPTLDKTIVETEGDTAVNETSIGDDVTFKLTGSVPDMTGYNRYYYVVNDTLSKGLTYKEITSIKVGETVLSASDYEVIGPTDGDSDSTTIKIVLKDFLAKYAEQSGDEIEILYKATLNEDAEIGTAQANLNTATLTYSNDPKFDYDGDKPEDDQERTPPTGETPESTTETYTTSLTINKVDADGQKLTGAAFKIEGDSVSTVVTTGDVYVASNEGSYWKLNDGTYTDVDPNGDGVDTTVYASTEQKYAKQTSSAIDTSTAGVSAEAFVNSDGTLTFAGLGAGTYTVTETVTPEGYNTIDPFTVEITFDKDAKTFSATKNGEALNANNDCTFTMDVVNQQGNELPSTGGIGTTIFYTVGGALMVGAAAMMIIKKRATSKE